MAQAPQATPLMPHATAAWLVDNSSLTFEQIAEFCGLHILEVQAIADDTAATKLTGRDPVRAGELTHEEIQKGQADSDYRLQMHKAPEAVRRTETSGRIEEAGAQPRRPLRVAVAAVQRAMGRRAGDPARGVRAAA